MAPFLLNETAPIAVLLYGLVLLVAGPLYIWLLVAIAGSNAQSRGTAMLLAAGLAVVGWLGSLAGFIESGISILLFLPAVVCLFRLRSLWKEPPIS